MHNKSNMVESFSNKERKSILTRRPLSAMETVDLMIYGEDVIPSNLDQSTAMSLTNNIQRNQNV